MTKAEQRTSAQLHLSRDGGSALCLVRQGSLILLVLLLVVAGCGKKGLPVPDYSQQMFSWRNVFAVMSEDGCISISGSVSGETRNLAFMVLDLEPLEASCAGCPFVAQESFRMDPADAWESPDGQTFRFVYCPAARSDVYRWRLVGHNVFSSLPAVSTPVRTLGIGQ